ncbi:MAG: MerR family transcriptional regulator [Sedimentisphaerales bacterium]|nr:MerR family transcriptional regulator [Sedimentisphaerales bacterium]
MCQEKKPQPQLMRISQAAKAGGVSKQTLQYYLMCGLIEPSQRTPSGHQLFDQKAIERIKLVKQINKSGYPLREIRDIFLDHQP